MKKPLLLLALFCFFSALYYLYLTQIDDPLSGIHCESSLRLSHTVINTDGTREGIVMDGAMNFAFTGNKQGVLIIGGVISDNKKHYNFKKTFNFDYTRKPIFYQFSFQPVKNQNEEEVPLWLINILLSKIGNYIEISKLDDKNLMLGNMFSPMQVCNITQ